jgi:hypothetical protein
VAYDFALPGCLQAGITQGGFEVAVKPGGAGR